MQGANTDNSEVPTVEINTEIKATTRAIAWLSIELMYARGLLGWSPAKLAEESGVEPSAIKHARDSRSNGYSNPEDWEKFGLLFERMGLLQGATMVRPDGKRLKLWPTEVWREAGAS